MPVLAVGHVEPDVYIESAASPHGFVHLLHLASRRDYEHLTVRLLRQRVQLGNQRVEQLLAR